jgi:hypothetical protein
MKKVLRRETITAPRPTVKSDRRHFPGAVAMAVVAIGIAAAAMGSAQSAEHLASITPVQVLNTAAVRDVNNPAHDPFAKRVYPSAANAASFTVPAGKRLIITQLAAFSYGSTTLEDFAVYTTTNGSGSAATVPATVNNQGMVYADSVMSVEADAGTTVTVAVDDSNGSDNAGMNVDLHGYYVDSY